MTRAITVISLSKLKNEYHVQFHQSVHALIVTTGVEELNFGLLYTRYTSALNNESEALDFVTKSELTPQILEQDHVRDGIFRGFSDIVKGMRNHFDPAMRTSANLLWSIFKHYGNVAQKPLDAETAAINDLLRELAAPEHLEALTALKLGEWAERLGEENARFQSMMMDRYTEVNAKSPYRMKTARLETDRYFHAIVADIDNGLLVASTVPPEIGNFVASLNAIIARFKNILAQGYGKNAAGKNGETGGENTAPAAN